MAMEEYLCAAMPGIESWSEETPIWRIPKHYLPSDTYRGGVQWLSG
jgi:hypothetical protein